MDKKDINQVTLKELSCAQGIDHLTAKCIIASRPYRNWTEISAKLSYHSSMHISLKILHNLKQAFYIIETEEKKQKDKSKASTKIPHTLRNLVWKTYASDTYLSTNCFCCRKNIISIDNFICGHIVSRYDGGTIDLDNLRPVCNSCNVSMGTCDMFEFIKNNKLWLDNSNNNSNNNSNKKTDNKKTDNKKTDNITTVKENLCKNTTTKKRLRENTIKHYGYDLNNPEQGDTMRKKIASEYFDKQIKIDMNPFIKSVIDEYITTYYFEFIESFEKAHNILQCPFVDISNIKNTTYINYFLKKGEIWINNSYINPINPITNKNTKKYLIKCTITIIDSSVCHIKLCRL
jgi:hypothetical protein